MTPTRDDARAPLLDLRDTTLVFVGGRISLADGSELDSRQPMTDAASVRAVRTALTSCAEWWSVVSSVVLPTLEGVEGAFAVLSASRTTARATSDGEIRRASLRRTLRGGVGVVSFQRTGPNIELPEGHRHVATLRSRQGEHMGCVGVRADNGREQWRFLDGSDFYLRLVADQLGARAVVDANGTFLTSAYGPLDVESLSVEFEARSSSAGPQLVVVPDTVEMRDRVKELLAGSPGVGRTAAIDVSPFDPGAPRDPDDYLRLPVLRAECTVTGLLRAGQWEEASDLEAARMLLLNRFDLKLGLWDLALNPVLRATVLDSSPVEPAPEQPGQAPAAARASAKREAAKATTRRETSKRAAANVMRALHRTLAQGGWRLKDGVLSLPLTEPLANWPDAPRSPLAVLRIEVNMSAVRVVVWHSLYNDLDINAFVVGRRAAFEGIAALPEPGSDVSSAQLWTAASGWGDEDVDWSVHARAITACTERWVGLLEDFLASCRAVRRARFSRRG